MPSTLAQNPCSCKSACAGYGTRQNCPPLIVLAVLAQTSPQSCKFGAQPS